MQISPVGPISFYAGMAMLFDGPIDDRILKVAKGSLLTGDAERKDSLPALGQREVKEKESKQKDASSAAPKPKSLQSIAARGFTSFVPGAAKHPTHTTDEYYDYDSDLEPDLINPDEMDGYFGPCSSDDDKPSSSALISRMSRLPDQSDETTKTAQTANQALMRLVYLLPSKEEIDRFFKDHPAINLNVLDSNGKTALYRALHSQHPPQDLIAELLHRNADYKPGITNVPIQDVGYILKHHSAPSSILTLLRVGKNANEIMDYITNFALSEENTSSSRMACSFVLEINEELILAFQKLFEFFKEHKQPMRDPAKIIRAYLIDDVIVDFAQQRLSVMRIESGKI